MATNTCRLKAAGSPRHKALSLPKCEYTEDSSGNRTENELLHIPRYPNVYWAPGNRWQARIMWKRERQFLGSFETQELAYIKILEFQKTHPKPTLKVAPKRSPGRSQYTGVAYATTEFRRKPWSASIRHNKKRYNLGYFATEEAAARAYDKKCLELRGPDARLNFPLDKP